MKVVAVVGMAGSGKSEAAKILEQYGFVRVRFGDITDEEVRRRGLPLNEESERRIREQLRQKYGMAAYAILSLSKIDVAKKQSNVVVDGLYSWEEYTFLKTYYSDDFHVIAVWASPKIRYARLSNRLERKLTLEEATSRDRAEVENLNKGGPIAMADFTVINESSFRELEKQVKKIAIEVKK